MSVKRDGREAERLRRLAARLRSEVGPSGLVGRHVWRAAQHLDAAADELERTALPWGSW